MKRVWIAGLVIVALAGAGAAYQAFIAREARSQTPPAPPGGAPPVPVLVTEAKRQSVPVELNAVGTVQSIANVAVKSRVDGAIDKVLVQDGQTVKAGDILFQIDPRLAQAALDQAQAQLARDKAQRVNANRDVSRYKPLAQQEFVSKQQLDTSSTTAEAAAAQVKADEAMVENTQTLLSFYTIKAPIDGRLGFVTLKLGNNIKANDVPLATINQIKPIYVNFPLPQVNLPAVREALARGAVEVDARPTGDAGKPEIGKIAFFDNAIDATTGTILVRASFENATERLWPGEFVSVKVRLSTEQDALTVPVAAVQVGQKDNYVFVVKPDNTVEYRPVTVGRLVDTDAVIAKGLEPGEKVVIDGQLRVTNGARVSIRPPAPAAATKSGDAS